MPYINLLPHWTNREIVRYFGDHFGGITARDVKQYRHDLELGRRSSQSDAEPLETTLSFQPTLHPDGVWDLVEITKPRQYEVGTADEPDDDLDDDPSTLSKPLSLTW